MVQNAEQYGQDPDFQASAMRTVRTTSQRMMDLMGKLASQSKGHEIEKEKNIQEVDVNGLIQETLESLNGGGCRPTFNPGMNLPPLQLQVEPMKQVLLNVILNARQAMDEQGTIDIVTTSDGQNLKVEITDTGPGIPVDRLEDVFQPFKSSKKTGWELGCSNANKWLKTIMDRFTLKAEKGMEPKLSLHFEL